MNLYLNINASGIVTMVCVKKKKKLKKLKWWVQCQKKTYSVTFAPLPSDLECNEL